MTGKKPLNLNIKEGALTKQLKQKYGSKAFTPKGTIKVEYLKKAQSSGSPLMSKRANLALNMRKWKK